MYATAILDYYRAVDLMRAGIYPASPPSSGQKRDDEKKPAFFVSCLDCQKSFRNINGLSSHVRRMH